MTGDMVPHPTFCFGCCVYGNLVMLPPQHDRTDPVAVVGQPSDLSQIPAENRTPVGQRSGSGGDTRGHPSRHLAKDNGANLTESPRGVVSGRARRSPLGNAQIKVVRTPARRLGGGRGDGKPPMPGRSERKPPRYDVRARECHPVYTIARELRRNPSCFEGPLVRFLILPFLTLFLFRTLRTVCVCCL